VKTQIRRRNPLGEAVISGKKAYNGKIARATNAPYERVPSRKEEGIEENRSAEVGTKKTMICQSWGILH